MLYELMAITFVLRAWKKDPNLSKREIGVWSHWKDESAQNELPLTESEVERMKSFMRRHSPTTYHDIFPEDRRVIQ